MGILLHHLPWNPALLPTGSLNLDSNVDIERQGNLRACGHLRHHWPCFYGIDDSHRSGLGRSACNHAMEYSDEATSKNPSFRVIVFRLNVRCLKHNTDAQTNLHSASIITMVRIPYVNKFEGQTNLQCKTIQLSMACKANLKNSLGRTHHALLQHRNRHRLYSIFSTLLTAFLPTQQGWELRS